MTRYLESVATLPQVQGGGYGNGHAQRDGVSRARLGLYKAIRLLTGELLTSNVDWYLRKGFHVEEHRADCPIAASST
jgi:hypothetical protein